MKSKFLILILLFLSSFAQAQNSFEIQVYPAETVPEHTTMIELHSIYTFGGTNFTGSDIIPTHHQLRETIEITHGFSDIFETGIYLFNSLNPDGSFAIAGTDIHPRIAAPESWKLPFGLSLSSEISYLKNEFSESNWGWEVRPIIDKKIGKLYMALNPVFDKALSSNASSKGWEFSPCARISYPVSKKIALGLEYYGNFGDVANMPPKEMQYHQVFAVTDLDIFKDWEINIGYGTGFTPISDNGVLKLIVGYKLGHSPSKQHELAQKNHPVIPRMVFN